MVVSGYVKGAKKTLFIQTIQIMIMTVSNFLLGGITGVVVNLISVVRNIVCYKGKLNWAWKAFLVVIQIIASLMVNQMGWIGLMPMIAGVVYTIFLGVENEKSLKFLISSVAIFWLIFDFTIQNYASASFDIMTIISGTIGFFRARKNENKA